jgi:hypothetical protein
MFRRIKDWNFCSSIWEQVNAAIIASIIYRLCFADFFYVRCASPINAGQLGTPVGNAYYKREKNNLDLVAAFCLFMRTSPINFALLSGNGNIRMKKLHYKLFHTTHKQTLVRTVHFS